MSNLVIGVLGEAWHRFGGFPVNRQSEIARWVQRRVREIQDGPTPPVRLTLVKPTLPRAFTDSWYERAEPEREPGDEQGIL